MVLEQSGDALVGAGIERRMQIHEDAPIEAASSADSVPAYRVYATRLDAEESVSFDGMDQFKMPSGLMTRGRGRRRSHVPSVPDGDSRDPDEAWHVLVHGE